MPRLIVTSDQMYAWLLDALRAHPGGAADPIVAQRLAGALAAFVNATRSDAHLEGGPTCSSCDEPSVVKLGRTPFCVAHFGEAMRGLRQGLEGAIAEGSATP